MDVLMPQLGETVSEGTIATWFKQEGDSVAAGERLFEIETDKVSMEVEASEAGRLAEILVAVGQTAPVGATVARLDPVDERASAPPATTPLPPAPSTDELYPAMQLAPFQEVRSPRRHFGPARPTGSLPVSPLARRLAAETNTDLTAVIAAVDARGGRRVRKADVLGAGEQRGTDQIPAAQTPGAAAPTAAPRAAEPAATRSAAPDAGAPRAGDSQTQALNKVRRATARGLTTSWQTIPHVSQAVEVDFTRVEADRTTRKADVRQRDGISLTSLAYVAQATCQTLRSFARLNASLEGDSLILHRRIHLGIAVDNGHEGLFVPVIRDADHLGLVGLAVRIAELARRVRSGTLKADDLGGATYTLTNNGAFGTLFTTPIINPPEVAILSIDAISRRPTVRQTEWGEMVVSAPMGMLTQSFDHRAVDGAYAASFLRALKQQLEAAPCCSL